MEQSTDIALVKIDQARHLLAAAETVEEVKQVADVAEAARAYAKRVGSSTELINRAVAIKLMAERKAGEILAKMEMKPGPKSNNNNALSTPRLKEMGVTPIQSSRWQQSAKVPEPEFQTYVEQSTATGKEITSAGLYKLANRVAPKNGARTPERTEGTCTDLSELVSAGQKFGTIYADPPWSYDNQGTRAATGNHYGAMTIEELCAMPVAELAADKCHLHLWTTNAFLFECPRLFAAWGFEFKSSFVWVKPTIGIGNYWRNSHEIMLLAVRGGQTAISRAERSWVECGRGMHSAKPEQARHSIERLSPGPYLELFGRSPRQGWTVFGNQIVEELVTL